MSTVFDVFKESPFTYLEVSRGNVFGNRVINQTQLNGIVKIRSGFTRDGKNMETYGGNNVSDKPTVHAHPQDFMPNDPIIGNGIRYNNVDYEIVGLTVGKNFENGEIEHYTLTLREASYVYASN